MRDKYNRTLLYYATGWNDRADIVHMVIINGCDVGARIYDGSSAYPATASNNSTSSLHLLLEYNSSHVDVCITDRNYMNLETAKHSIALTM